MGEMRAPFVGTEDALTERIIKVYYEVYNELGYGFLEAAYGRAMGIALEQSGLRVASEVLVPVVFRGVMVSGYRADLVVEGKVILELKTRSPFRKRMRLSSHIIFGHRRWRWA